MLKIRLMSKKIFVFYLFFLIIPLNSGYTQSNVFFEKHQKNIEQFNVKTEIRYNHSYKNNKPDNTGYKNIVKTYNQNGDILTHVQYNSRGDVVSKEEYKYTPDNLLTSYKRFDARRNKLVYRKSYFYGHDEKREKEEGFNGTDYYTIRYKYDDKGKLITILYYTGDNLNEKRTISYADNKKTIKVFGKDDIFLFEIIEFYDEQDLLIKQVKYDDTKKEHWKYVYVYNDRGQKLNETKFEEGKFEYKIIYAYDSNNRLAKISEEDEGHDVFIKRKLFYNEKGQLTEEEYRKSADKDFSKKTYQYNENGLCVAIDWLYATYNYRTLFKIEYGYYE